MELQRQMGENIMKSQQIIKASLIRLEEQVGQFAR